MNEVQKERERILAIFEAEAQRWENAALQSLTYADTFFSSPYVLLLRQKIKEIRSELSE